MGLGAEGPLALDPSSLPPDQVELLRNALRNMEPTDAENPEMLVIEKLQLAEQLADQINRHMQERQTLQHQKQKSCSALECLKRSAAKQQWVRANHTIFLQTNTDRATVILQKDIEEIDAKLASLEKSIEHMDAELRALGPDVVRPCSSGQVYGTSVDLMGFKRIHLANVMLNSI